jgi:hypothetical protein
MRSTWIDIKEHMPTREWLAENGYHQTAILLWHADDMPGWHLMPLHEEDIERWDITHWQPIGGPQPPIQAIGRQTHGKVVLRWVSINEATPIERRPLWVQQQGTDRCFLAFWESTKWWPLINTYGPGPIADVTHWRELDLPPLVGTVDPDNPSSGRLVISPPSAAEKMELADQYMAELRKYSDAITEWIDGVMEDRAIRKIEMRRCIEETLAGRAADA